MKKETLITISKRTGYSISTVSRVLSGKAAKYRISDKTVEIITAEAERCNYTPNMIAKGLCTNKTYTIGLLIPDVENPFFANIASTIIYEAKNSEYTIILVNTMESVKHEEEGLKSLLSRSVDGIILVPCGNTPEYIEKISNHTTPILLIDRHFSGTSLSYVCTDNFQGAFDATQHLINNGHKKIACIQGVAHSMPVKERIRGYSEALKANGLSGYSYISGENFSIKNGYIETKLILNSNNRPTAIFAMSSTILLGAIKAIREAGLSIPNDISIISFDNSVYLDFFDPAITRIAQPINDIGSLSIKLLIKEIDNPDLAPMHILLPPSLIIRDSVATLPRSE